MSIEMNFGWLNDYTGSRFAPFTLANLVLMQTSAGQVESFYDFVEAIDMKLEAAVDELTKDFKSADKRLIQLTWKNPEYENEETGELEPVPPLGVQYAAKLTPKVGETGQITDTIGFCIGNRLKPIYFYEGIPVECQEAIVNRAPMEIDGGFFDYSKPEPEIQSPPEGTYMGKTSGNSDSGLRVNISGVAANAEFANEAIFARYARNAQFANQVYYAYHLKQDIAVGAGYNKEGRFDSSTTYGDIIGTIKTSTDNSPRINSHDLPATLELKQILSSVNEAGYGQAYKTGTIKGTMYVPSFKLDKKGRIIEVQDYQYNVNLKLDRMSSRSDIKTAYLVTVNSPAGDNPDYIYSQGANDDKSIYIEWGSDVADPILMGAAWNDYAEYRNQKEIIEAGYCVKSNDDGRVERTTEHLSICDGIVSDTFGFSIGKSETYQTPLAVSGRVLAYCKGNREDYHAGDVVCAGEDGKVCKMTREEIREYPDRIVGTVSEIPSYETWNKKLINGRIWIKVK